jgi:hypothetical protein
MTEKKSKRLWFLGSLLFLTVGFSGTRVLADPPPWAPAHGYRAKHYRYYYYPASQVYFDTERKLYFYSTGGRWRLSAQLPGVISLHARDYVALDLDSDRPYVYHPEVAKKYPPGLVKKQMGKGKKKEKKEFHWK